MNFITIAYAQTTGSNTGTVEGILVWFINLINSTLVPLIFALAFLLFLFGVFRYFFGSGAEAEENRKKGRQFMLWAIIALAIMICIWGIVNILVRTIPGLEGQARPPLPCFSGNDCNRSTGTSNSFGQPTNLLPSNPANEPTGQDGLPGIY